MVALLRIGALYTSSITRALIFSQVCELHVLVAHGSAMGIVNRREDIIESFDLVKPTFVASVPALMNRVGLQLSECH